MTRKRILITEDESIIAMDLEARLLDMDYEVVAVTSTGEQALRRTAELVPDLILMDIVLKGPMDGIETAKCIRAQFDIPIIYLTAHSDKPTLQRATVTEAYGYILKPFEDRELHTMIEVALYKHRAERQIKESEARFRALIEHASDIVAVLDKGGVLTYMSPSAQHVLGYAPAEMVGKSLFDFVPDEQVPAVSAITTALLEHPGQTTPLTEYNVRDNNGDWRTMAVVATNLLEHTAVQGIVLNCHDITRRKQAEDKIFQFASELQTRNEDLRAYAHSVAHDLKTPLGLIIGYAGILRSHLDELTKDERGDYLDTIMRTSTKMSHIISEMLLLAEVREAEVPISPLNMAAIVDETLLRLEATIAACQAEIIRPAEWPAVIGYAGWIEEVWANYISNALKYGGHPPRIELGFSLLDAEGADPDTATGVRFWVSDNGIGLTTEQQAALFRSHSRLGQTNNNGHGLGLSIVKRIVEKLGGQVSVDSTGVPGEGSTFGFTLPIANRQEEQ